MPPQKKIAFCLKLLDLASMRKFLRAIILIIFAAFFWGFYFPSKTPPSNTPTRPNFSAQTPKQTSASSSGLKIHPEDSPSEPDLILPELNHQDLILAARKLEKKGALSLCNLPRNRGRAS